MPFYLTPKQDDFNKIPELQVCIAEALYDVDSIVADAGAYTNAGAALTAHGRGIGYTSGRVIGIG